MNIVNQNFPNPVSINYEPYSFETFSSRFRDAVRGVAQFHQCPEMLPVVEKWWQSYSVVRGENGHVMIGEKSLLREWRKKNASIGTLVDANITLASNAIETPTASIIQAILTLMNAHIIQDAILSNASLELVNQLIPKHSPDRTIEVLENNNQLILL